MSTPQKAMIERWENLQAKINDNANGKDDKNAIAIALKAVMMQGIISYDLTKRFNRE